MSDRMQYVVGFAFDAAHNVVLIRKTKPEWQAGRLNGVGGKIERMETEKAAMVREFEEETGVQTSEDDWKGRAVLHAEEWIVYAFAAFLPDVTFKVRTTTEEQIQICSAYALPINALRSVRYLVPMMLDEQLHEVHLGYKPGWG